MNFISFAFIFFKFDFNYLLSIINKIKNNKSKESI
jgi:hypothetical protein